MRQPSTNQNTSDLVGRRVVVRYRLHGDEFGATDVLGVLVSRTDDELRVRPSRGGDVVAVPAADVVVVKEIPELTVTRRDVRDLEAAALLGWRALETEWQGGWLLRASGGFTGRGNSCLPLGDPGRPLADAVARVEDWYRARGLVPAFQVPESLGRALGPVLDARGWPALEDRTFVMVAPVPVVRGSERAGLPPVRVDDRPDDAWLAGYHYRGGELPAHAVSVLVNADSVGFASVDDDGARLAIARGAVSDAPSGRRWLGVTAVEVAPEARRRGLGGHIVAGLAEWAGRLGATDVYLQVAEPNAPARATYRKAGFAEHHAYHYRRLR
ncbi:GNAT family N-acetyltransferase [Jiangella sp. DSM 45060]|uniref:GNAT family N-acetyltransferase n=1 Tax=Jiangella sp. DSM 45060 TaxID=1798224 RepID=UPI00087D7BF3|nr:GNAT family N-acetyltransferase [Jiangella sp. DSM 45060]SDT54378.1 Acetyltransferase (GNAT) family protein [Jiangella sp. DSM 45060]